MNADGAITGHFDSRALPEAAAAHRALLGMGVHRALSPTRTRLEPGAQGYRPGAEKGVKREHNRLETRAAAHM